MMKKKTTLWMIPALTAIIFILSACQTRISDSGFSLKTMGKPVDSNIYIVNVTMMEAPVSNADMGAEGKSRQFSDLYGYGNFRLWQDGKGMVMVRVNSVNPSLDYIKPGMDVILKTTDLKVMAIQSGYQFEVKCRNDYEPVASLQDNEMTSGRYDTYELDFCRMTNPEVKYNPVKVE